MKPIRTLQLSFTKDDWASVFGALATLGQVLKQPELLDIALVIKTVYRQTFPDETRED